MYSSQTNDKVVQNPICLLCNVRNKENRLNATEQSEKGSFVIFRHCSTVAATVLNTAFLAIGARLEGLRNRVDETIRQVKTDAEMLACSRALNALELTKMQYKLLRAVTWRYTHPPSEDRQFPRLCFYAGSLLDDLNDLLRRLAKCYALIVDSRDTLSCVAGFVNVCKRFMNFFEKVSERRVNR